MLTTSLINDRQPNRSAPELPLLSLFTRNKISRRPSSFYSASYKMVFPQLLCFENDPSFMGGVRVCVATRLDAAFILPGEEERRMANFLEYNPEQAYLLPPTVREVLGEGHLCFF